VIAGALALGVITEVIAGTVPDSFSNALDRFEVRGSIVDQFLSVAFLFLATIVALIPASQVGAAADEETSGRLVHVLARPAGRGSLLAGRLALTGAAIVVAGLLAGVAVWLGAVSRGVDVSLGALVGAGLNTVPTALLTLGIGALMLAVAPRAAVTTVYAVVIGSLVIDLLGSLVSGARWVERLSLFHYMASAPSQAPDPATLAVTLAAAAILCALATIFYARRDLATA
jgi:ABC-2 type transport system permease protein